MPLSLSLSLSLDIIDEDERLAKLIRSERRRGTLVTVFERKYYKVGKTEAAKDLNALLNNYEYSLALALQEGNVDEEQYKLEKGALDEFAYRVREFNDHNHPINAQFIRLRKNFKKNAVIREFYIPSESRTVVEVNADGKVTAFFGYSTTIKQYKDPEETE